MEILFSPAFHSYTLTPTNEAGYRQMIPVSLRADFRYTATNRAASKLKCARGMGDPFCESLNLNQKIFVCQKLSYPDLRIYNGEENSDDLYGIPPAGKF